MPRGRVLILLPYWDFWAGSVEYDLRAEREGKTHFFENIRDLARSDGDRVESAC